MRAAFIGNLPREWRQVRQFLDAGGGSFKTYSAWCKTRDEKAIADTESRFRMLVYMGERIDEFAAAFADAGNVYVLAR